MIHMEVHFHHHQCLDTYHRYQVHRLRYIFINILHSIQMDKLHKQQLRNIQCL